MTPLFIVFLKLLAGALVSLIVGMTFKGLLWLREVKTNHLPHIQAAAEEARDAALSIAPAIERQTTAIVTELREQRSDIRNLTAKL
jgi:hypothetical protein